MHTQFRNGQKLPRSFVATVAAVDPDDCQEGDQSATVSGERQCAA